MQECFLSCQTPFGFAKISLSLFLNVFLFLDFFFFFFWFNNFINLFRLCCVGFSLILASGDYSLVVAHGLLLVVASLIVDHRL